jgi:uncharacterized protein
MFLAEAQRLGARQAMVRVLHAVNYTRPGVAPMTRRAQTMYLLRCAVHFGALREWFGDATNPALQEELLRRPSLIGCIRRPYMNGAWPVERKMEAIRQHYLLLSQEFAFLRFCPEAAAGLACLDEGLEIRLDKAPWFEHEGEITINLFKGDARLYSLVFTLGAPAGRRVAYVGALQGFGNAEALATYRELTHRLHGLRPRDLLITAFRHLCVALDVERILAAGDGASVSRSAYFRKTVTVHAKYDEAWAENGGTLAEEGFFALDPHFKPRDAAEIPSRKRAQYRRRYEFLEALRQQIDASVKQAGGPHAGIATITAADAATGQATRRVGENTPLAGHTAGSRLPETR